VKWLSTTGSQLMTEKLIKDIRLCESDQENVEGKSLPGGPGKIYKVNSKVIVALAQRYARKLNELGFNTPVYDHVYVNMTPILSPGKAVVSSRQVEKWLVYVDIGVSPEELRGQTLDIEYERITKIITKAFKALCERDNLDFDLVKKAESFVLKEREQLEIAYLSKDASKYSVTLTYQISSQNGKSPVFIEYLDKMTNKKGKVKLIDLVFYDDIYSLISSIAIKDCSVVMKPRSSSKANLHTNSYKVPVTISVDAILKGC